MAGARDGSGLRQGCHQAVIGGSEEAVAGLRARTGYQ